MMKEFDEKIPDPKEIEKEISDFIAKKFGGNVKIASHFVLPEEVNVEKSDQAAPKKKKINFNLKPEELVSYLDQYIVKQDNAKAVLATKICTHFNRIKRLEDSNDEAEDLVGGIKSNVLMIGPTGVGKTYIIKLIAKKIGVPFVKGDATKFSETGYVGGDVEDLVRDLVREADDDIEVAQYGIIYIDEIDKIASSRNLIGADVSRTGVQRALLKPMEETDVEMKVPHDPISMIQEIDQFRKTGKRNSRTVNTKNILFIMSGAFNELIPIIQKRISSQSIGFSASFSNPEETEDILKHVSSEDLIEMGFESEFVGRLPVRTVFEKLTKDDLFEILKNPNNPIILGKKLDFAAYDIEAKFDDNALRLLAEHAFSENTGARGLVSAVEKALLVFEKKLPSTNIDRFPINEKVIKNSEQSLNELIASPDDPSYSEAFHTMLKNEETYIENYLELNKNDLSNKHNLTLTPLRIHLAAQFYAKHILDIGKVINRIKFYCDEIKKMELDFFKIHNINIVLEDDAIDFILEQFIASPMNFDDFYKTLTTRMTEDFKDGLALLKEKTEQKRFFISRESLLDPIAFLNKQIKDELS